MRQLFFCAKDIRDYLSAVIDVSEFNSVPDFDPKFPPLNDAPPIQKVLRDCMDLYEDCEQILNAPVCMDTGVDGLRFDFNFGLRLEVPEGNFHVQIGDAVTEQIFFDRDISDVQLISVEKFLINWHIEVFREGVKVFEHKFNVKNRPVLIAFKKRPALGDAVAAIPSVAEFERQTGCKLTVFLPEFLREFAANLCPELEQVDSVRIENYATFYLGWIIGTLPILPVDSRMVPIERVSETHLGMKLYPPKPTFKPTAPPVTDEPYVCIAVQASAPEKGWLYPNGWDIVVDYLKSLGYRVFCIDKNSAETNDGMTIRKPANAEDFTGDLPIMHRANMLH
ncbi:MAG: autotransporter strand-loop-strand O-heptosyltransferase, partial [Selenomonadaceae bacterium]|nr:autotransporter strand-loop-strand O-heptosyltransferase [Selenomonadaceae bacterium]